MQSLRSFILCLFLFFLPVAVFGAQDRWTALGPFGGNVAQVLFQNGTPFVFAVGQNGNFLYRSANLGETWRRIGVDADVLRLDPTNTHKLYAAGEGLYSSTDSGLSWQEVSHLIYPYPFIRTLNFEFHSTKASTLYALSTDNEFFRSDDTGKTWNLTTIEADAFEVDPHNGDVIYFVNDNAVFRSRDAGRSVEQLSSIQGNNLRNIAIDPNQTQNLYASSFNQVFRSEDQGKHWVSTQCACHPMKLAILQENPQTLYALGTPVRRTRNGGRSWESLSLSGGTPGDRSGVIYDMASDPVKMGVMIAAGEENGLHRSEDNGATWRSVNNGIYGLDIWQITKQEEALFAIGNSDVYHSTNNGVTWKLEPHPFDFGTVIAHPLAPDLLFAVGISGLGISNNHGQSWTFLTQYPGDGLLAPDPRNQNILYSSIAGGADGTRGIAKSIDQGRTWQIINAGLTDKHVCKITVHPANGRIVLAGTQGSRIFRSNDAGATWKLVLDLQSLDPITAIAFDPKKPNIALALSAPHLLKSTDFGNTWASFEVSALGNLQFLEFDQLSTAYAGGDSGLFVSRDWGTTWTRFVSRGLPVAGGKCLTILPDQLLLGNRGVFRLDR